MPLTITSLSPALTAPVRGRVMRELSVQPPRIEADRKIDLPEIQAPYRVSFSDQAKATAALPARAQENASDDEVVTRALKAYREMARL